MCSRIRTGSVVQDKRDKVWRFYWWENGKRRSKCWPIHDKSNRVEGCQATARCAGSKPAKQLAAYQP